MGTMLSYCTCEGIDVTEAPDGVTVQRSCRSFHMNVKASSLEDGVPHSQDGPFSIPSRMTTGIVVSQTPLGRTTRGVSWSDTHHRSACGETDVRGEPNELRPDSPSLNVVDSKRVPETPRAQ